MVSQLNNRTVARDEGYQQVQYIAGRWTSAGSANLPANAKVGTIPAGAVITSINTRVVTAVAGGTPVLAVGAVAAGATAPTFPLSAGNTLNATVAEAAGSEILPPTADIAQPLASDYDVYVGVSGGVTSGDAIVIVGFIKPVS